MEIIKIRESGKYRVEVWLSDQADAIVVSFYDLMRGDKHQVPLVEDDLRKIVEIAERQRGWNINPNKKELTNETNK